MVASMVALFATMLATMRGLLLLAVLPWSAG